MAKRFGAAAALLIPLWAHQAHALQEVALKACAQNQEQLRSCQEFLQFEQFKRQCYSDDGDAGDVCISHICVLSEDCFTAVAEGDADWTVADPLMIYFLDQEYGNTPKAIAPFAVEMRGDASRRSRGTGSGEGAGYYSVALVRSETCRKTGGRFTLENAKGLRSCHTRYGDLAGWAFPVYQLEKRQLASGDDDLAVVSSFFNTSCAPSNGDEKLCSACNVKQQCNLSDRYAGDMGVIQGLQADACDIGFVDNFAALATLVDDGAGGARSEFALVCNGGCQPVEQVERPGCYLGHVRNDALIVRDDNDFDAVIQQTVLAAGKSPQFAQLFDRPSSGNSFFSSYTTSLADVETSVADYLGEFQEVMDNFQRAAALRDSASLDQSGSSSAVSGGTSTTVADVTNPPIDGQSGDAQSHTAAGAHVANSFTKDGDNSKSGTSSWAIALTFFLALGAGLMAGAVAMKAYHARRQKDDEFYRTHMHQDDEGIPNTDDTFGAGSSGADEPFSVNEARLPQAPAFTAPSASLRRG